MLPLNQFNPCHVLASVTLVLGCLEILYLESHYANTYLLRPH